MKSQMVQAEENLGLIRMAEHRIQAVYNRLRKQLKVNINSIRKIVKCPIKKIRIKGNS